MTSISAVGNDGDALREGLLKLADDELMVGHTLAALAGFGPELEINLVISSTGQEELGHARLFYGLVYDENAEAINAAIYDRDLTAFRSCSFAERRVSDWADMLVKQYLYDVADQARLQVFVDHGLDESIARRIEAEEEFQRQFWGYWARKAAAAGGPSLARIRTAVEQMWPHVGGLFQLDAGDTALQRDLDEARSAWQASTAAVLNALGVHDLPPLDEAHPTELTDRNHTLDEMRTLYREAPGRW